MLDWAFVVRNPPKSKFYHKKSLPYTCEHHSVPTGVVCQGHHQTRRQHQWNHLVGNVVSQVTSLTMGEDRTIGRCFKSSVSCSMKISSGEFRVFYIYPACFFLYYIILHVNLATKDNLIIHFFYDAS